MTTLFCRAVVLKFLGPQHDIGKYYGHALVLPEAHCAGVSVEEGWLLGAGVSGDGAVGPSSRRYVHKRTNTPVKGHFSCKNKNKKFSPTIKKNIAHVVVVQMGEFLLRGGVGTSRSRESTRDLHPVVEVTYLWGPRDQTCTLRVCASKGKT